MAYLKNKDNSKEFDVTTRRATWHPDTTPGLNRQGLEQGVSRQQGLEFGCTIAQEVRGLSRCLIHHYHCSLHHFCRYQSVSSEDLRERQ